MGDASEHADANNHSIAVSVSVFFYPVSSLEPVEHTSENRSLQPNDNNSTAHARPLAPNTIPPKHGRIPRAGRQQGHSETPPAAKRTKACVLHEARSLHCCCICATLGAKLARFPALALATVLGTGDFRYLITREGLRPRVYEICIAKVYLHDWREWRESCVASWGDCYPGS